MTPDRLWSFGRQTEIDYINTHTQDESYRRLLYAVVDAVLEIRERGAVTEAHVKAFSEGVVCSNEVVFGPAGKRLVECAHFSQLAADALRDLATHVKWRVRFNVMCLLEDRPPEELAIDLLRIGLQDKSLKVVCRAVQACDEVRYLSALTLLEECRSGEKRAEVQEAMDWTIGLMKTPPVMKGKQEERQYQGGVFVREVLRDR